MADVLSNQDVRWHFADPDAHSGANKWNKTAAAAAAWVVPHVGQVTESTQWDHSVSLHGDTELKLQWANSVSQIHQFGVLGWGVYSYNALL